MCHVGAEGYIPNVVSICPIPFCLPCCLFERVFLFLVCWRRWRLKRVRRYLMLGSCSTSDWSALQSVRWLERSFRTSAPCTTLASLGQSTAWVQSDVSGCCFSPNSSISLYCISFLWTALNQLLIVVFPQQIKGPKTKCWHSIWIRRALNIRQVFWPTCDMDTWWFASWFAEAHHSGSVLMAATRVWFLPMFLCCISSPLSPPLRSCLSHSTIKHKNAKINLKKEREIPFAQRSVFKLGFLSQQFPGNPEMSYGHYWVITEHSI